MIMHKKLKIYDVQTLHDHLYIYDHVIMYVYSVYFFSKGNDLLPDSHICFLQPQRQEKNSSWMVESRIRGAKFCGDASEAGGPITGGFNKRKVLMKVHDPMRKIS